MVLAIAQIMHIFISYSSMGAWYFQRQIIWGLHSVETCASFSLSAFPLSHYFFLSTVCSYLLTIFLLDHWSSSYSISRSFSYIRRLAFGLCSKLKCSPFYLAFGFFFLFCNWSISGLQYCVSFWYIAKWFSCLRIDIYTLVHIHTVAHIYRCAHINNYTYIPFHICSLWFVMEHWI